MKIKSKSHAMELLKALEKQGFISSWWRSVDNGNDRRAFQKNWFFVSKPKGDSV